MRSPIYDTKPLVWMISYHIQDNAKPRPTSEKLLSSRRLAEAAATRAATRTMYLKVAIAAL